MRVNLFHADSLSGDKSMTSWMDKFIIIAHRGASAYEPENTVKAFERAIELGADAIELDVRLSKDGIPIVLHDETLERVAGVNVRVRELPLSEIKKFRVFGSEPIPTLEEVLASFAPRIPVFIELKEVEAVKPVAEIVKHLGVTERVALISFHLEALRAIKSIAGDFITGLIISRRIYSLKNFLHLDIEAILPRYDVVSPRLVREAHAHGLKVYAWTVNDPAIAVRMIGFGVDGIATDKPDIKRAIEKQQTLLKYTKR